MWVELLEVVHVCQATWPLWAYSDIRQCVYVWWNKHTLIGSVFWNRPKKKRRVWMFICFWCGFWRVGVMGLGSSSLWCRVCVHSWEGMSNYSEKTHCCRLPGCQHRREEKRSWSEGWPCPSFSAVGLCCGFWARDRNSLYRHCVCKQEGPLHTAPH